MKNRKEISKKLNMPVYVGEKTYYRLSYCFNSEKNGMLLSNPKYMTNDDIINYFNVNYKDKDNIDIGKLVNDLVVFKAYKYDCELSLEDVGYIINTFSILLLIFSLISSILSNNSISYITGRIIAYLFMYLLVDMTYEFIFKKYKKNSTYNKLGTINYVISVLEVLESYGYDDSKEDFVVTKKHWDKKSYYYKFHT